jgi:ABC-type transporter Mla subunit MlaD
VSQFLAGDRQDLAGALNELSTALGQVKGFIENNRSLIKSNVSRLAAITQVLVNERASLAEAVDDAPLAVDNVLNAYNPVAHTLNGRGDLRELTPGLTAAAAPGVAQSAPGVASGNAVCASATSASTPLGSLCRQEQPGTGALVEVTPQDRLSLPPLPLPAVGTVYGSPGTVRGNGG